MPVISAYHGVDGATHQANVAKLSHEGYHPVTLCVYGDPGSPLYAAVWAQEPWPEWIVVQGQTSAEYQAWITGTVEPQGYSLRLVTTTGSASDVVFAAVAENTGVASAAQHGLTDVTLKTFLATQLAAGAVPTAIAPYGDPSNRRYAAVCQSSGHAVQWDYPGPLSAAAWQNHFNGYAQVTSRPGLLSVTADGLYISVFRNDTLGAQVTRIGMSASDFQTEVAQQTEEGFFPVCLAAGGTGSSILYAATFAQQTTPQPRSFTATGSPVPLLSGIDAIVQRFLETYGVRAGQVAVMRDGRLVYSRGFTWGEPGYRVTQPTSMMRIASCSKAYTSAAINALVNAGQLKLSDELYPTLGITSPAVAGAHPDPSINKATVQNILDHLGGWNDNGSSGIVYVKRALGYKQVPSLGYDPAFAAPRISQALGLSGAPTKHQVAAYLYGQPLQFVPGTTVYTKNADGTFSPSSTGAYSNFGYFLLGMVVEAVSAQPFMDYLRSAVLASIGLTDDVAVSEMVSPASNEVGYDEPNIGPTPFAPNTDTLVPAVNGGEGLITQLFDAPGGLMTSAQAMATFIHSNAVWGTGGRAAGFARSGGEAGSSSLAVSRGDGVDWAYILNTRWSLGERMVTGAGGNTVSAIEKLGSDINRLLDEVAW